MVVVFVVCCVIGCVLWLCLLREAVGFVSAVGPNWIPMKPTYIGFSIKIKENIRFLHK
jgi:hypothetical protein